MLLELEALMVISVQRMQEVGSTMMEVVETMAGQMIAMLRPGALTVTCILLTTSALLAVTLSI